MSVLLNTVIADLYEGVFQIEFSNFRRFAMDQAQRLIQRDKVMWLTIILATKTILGATMINQDFARLLKFQEILWDKDPVLRASVENPDMPLRYGDVGLEDFFTVHVPAMAGDFDNISPHMMIISTHDPHTDIVEVLSQYRFDPERPFTDEERDTYRILFPHMTAAWRHRQLLKLYEDGKSASPGARYGRRGNAVVTAAGMIEAADAFFSETMLSRFGDWKGPLLPAPILPMLSSGARTLRLAGLEFKLTPGGDNAILSVSEAADAEVLSPAEQRVAALFAEGHSYAVVAKRLGVSKSTIRNQISSIYRKLDVHSKVQLVRISQP